MTFQDAAWQVIRALLIFSAAWVGGTWVRAALRRVLDGRLEPTTAGFLVGAVRPAALALALPPALESLGVSMSSALALLSTVGLAVALALRDSLSNVASGAIILTLRPLRVGDRVTAVGRTGVVSRVGFLMIEMDTDDGRRIAIMNDKVLSEPIERHAADGNVRLELVVRLSRHPGEVGELEALVKPLGCEVVVLEVEAERVRVAVRCMVHPTAFAQKQRDLWRAVEAAVAPVPIELPTQPAVVPTTPAAP